MFACDNFVKQDSIILKAHANSGVIGSLRPKMTDFPQSAAELQAVASAGTRIGPRNAAVAPSRMPPTLISDGMASVETPVRP